LGAVAWEAIPHRPPSDHILCAAQGRCDLHVAVWFGFAVTKQAMRRVVNCTNPFRTDFGFLFSAANWKAAWHRLSASMLVVIYCGIALGCGAKSGQKITLRVNLFPYLPDAAGDSFRGMAARIKSEFETQNPSIKLEVTLDKNNDFYNLENYKDWLRRFDVVEPDTLFLSDLVNSGLIENWENAVESDWQPPAQQAAKVNGKIYAIPQWLCGYFLFSRDPRIAHAENIRDLVTALKAPHGDIPEIAGNLNSSWDTPTLYLESWEGNHAPIDSDRGISTDLDRETMRCLTQFSKQGEWKGSNPCLDKTYKDNNLAFTLFANGQVEASFGYSESLFDILKTAPGDVSIIISPLVLGNTNHPLLFMDGFVLRKGSSQNIKNAARKFVDYMQNPDTYAWIVMSQDAGKPATPRYLIPATVSAFAAEPIKSDRYYQAIQGVINISGNFPNSGLPSIHEQMQAAILRELLSAQGQTSR
jgi:thiamine pyridinylase